MEHLANEDLLLKIIRCLKRAILEKSPSPFVRNYSIETLYKWNTSGTQLINVSDKDFVFKNIVTPKYRVKKTTTTDPRVYSCRIFNCPSNSYNSYGELSWGDFKVIGNPELRVLRGYGIEVFIGQLHFTDDGRCPYGLFIEYKPSEVFQIPRQVQQEMTELRSIDPENPPSSSTGIQGILSGLLRPFTSSSSSSSSSVLPSSSSSSSSSSLSPSRVRSSSGLGLASNSTMASLPPPPMTPIRHPVRIRRRNPPRAPSRPIRTSSRLVPNSMSSVDLTELSSSSEEERERVEIEEIDDNEFEEYRGRVRRMKLPRSTSLNFHKLMEDHTDVDPISLEPLPAGTDVVELECGHILSELSYHQMVESGGVNSHRCPICRHRINA
jgi:hypothetical protein